MLGLEREAALPSTGSPAPHVTAMSRLSQELHPGLLRGCRGPKHVGHPALLSQAREQGTGSEVKLRVWISTQMGRAHCRQRPHVLCHSTSPLGFWSLVLNRRLHLTLGAASACPLTSQGLLDWGPQGPLLSPRGEGLLPHHPGGFREVRMWTKPFPSVWNPDPLVCPICPSFAFSFNPLASSAFCSGAWVEPKALSVRDESGLPACHSV